MLSGAGGRYQNPLCGSGGEESLQCVVFNIGSKAIGAGESSPSGGVARVKLILPAKYKNISDLIVKCHYKIIFKQHTTPLRVCRVLSLNKVIRFGDKSSCRLQVFMSPRL